MVNYPIDRQILEPYCPEGTEIDIWEGTCYISLVGFSFLNTKFKGVPLLLHRDFEEINLRFYVRYRGHDGWRRGVVFIKEVVPKPLVTSVARWLYNENYHTHSTFSTIKGANKSGKGSVEYGWKYKGEWVTMEAQRIGEPHYPSKGSFEEFISEHYWGYTPQADGNTLEYKVDHPQWKLWPVSEFNIKGDVQAFYGKDLGNALSKKPSSAFIADGSLVSVKTGKYIF